MGMFDSIIAEIECPKTRKTEKNEIQIKWREQRYRDIEGFLVGDTVNNIDPEYNNTWIKADYICQSCSPKTRQNIGGRKIEFVRVRDQIWHPCYVKIENGRIASVLTEEGFSKLGIEKFVVYD